MIKSELVQRIASQNPHLYQRDVENIVNAILGEIVAAMAAAIASSCAASAHSRSNTARPVPAAIHVPARMSRSIRKSVPFFKTGKEMRERLNRPAG